MEPVGFVLDKFKGIAKSGQDFVDGLRRRRENSSRRNPIEILKRLQREAFSDQMKLRERQDKLERLFSFYKTSKGSPFQETSTRLRGDVDVLGAILLLGNVNQEHYDALSRAGVRTGVQSKFTFETTIGERDILLAEFMAGQNGSEYAGFGSGSALSLEKVSYMANISDWFSVIAIPIGAPSRYLKITSNYSNRRKGFSDLSSVGPPLLNQHNGSTIGLTVKKSNMIATIAQSISGLAMHQPSFNEISHYFSTFGQISCLLSRKMKLTFSGLHQVPKSSSHHVNLGPLTIPFVFQRQHEDTEQLTISSGPLIESDSIQTSTTDSVALSLESELDENTKIGGWVEVKSSSSKQMKWGVNLFDDSEDETGWGMCVSGMVDGSSNWAHLQAESYLKLNLGDKLCIKPGIAYVADGNAKLFGVMLRSSWSF